MFDEDASIAKVLPPTRARLCDRGHKRELQPECESVIESGTYFCQEPSTAANVKNVHTLEPCLSVVLSRFIARGEAPAIVILTPANYLIPDELHSNWIHLVQESEFTLLVPPLRRQPGKMGNLGGVDRCEGGTRRCGRGSCKF